MPVFWLPDNQLVFPHPSLAEPDGLLAVGGELSVERLVLAYRNGIFPWFEEDGQFFWYAPDPRCVLFPKELQVHKSMRAVFNQQKFHYTFDTRFGEVMQACADAARTGQDGSWISPAFLAGYSRLHEQGVAHSVEVWDGDLLVGGLYGISMGKVFFGESMFAKTSNASKAGFITLARALEQADFKLIDCQQQTRHLETLGARIIPRELFLEYLSQNTYERTLVGKWQLREDGGLECVTNAAITPIMTK